MFVQSSCWHRLLFFDLYISLVGLLSLRVEFCTGKQCTVYGGCSAPSKWLILRGGTCDGIETGIACGWAFREVPVSSLSLTSIGFDGH